MKDPVGIVGYGAYIPRYRIKTSEVARAWGWDAEAYRKGLGMEEKSVAARDQDCITLAVEAARRAIRRARDRPGEDRRDLHRLRVASVRRQAQRHRPSPRRSGRPAGSTPPTWSSPARRAPRRCTSASRLVEAGRRRVRPGDRLRHRPGRAGRPARIRHRRRRRGVHLRARRRRGHDGRVGLVHHGHAGLLAPRGGALPAARRALHGRAGLFPSHDDGGAEAARADRPEGRRLRPRDLPSAERQVPGARGTMLGFSKEQCRAGLLSPRIGNVYSGASPLGLCAVLDVARPGERIFMVSYGSGAGSDGVRLHGHGPDRRGPQPRRRRSRRSCRSRPCSSTTRATRGSAARSRAKRIDRRFRY